MKPSAPLVAASLASLLLGSCVGILTGLSQSPVVGVLLPLLFGALGGTGGLFLARTDIANQSQKQTIMFTSVAVAMLAIGTIAGVFVGIDYRVGDRSWPSLGGSAMFPPADASGQEVVDWVLLDTRLRLLGLDVEQRHSVLKRIADSDSAEAAHIDIDGDRLRELLVLAMPSSEQFVEYEYSDSLIDEWKVGVAHATQLGILLNSLQDPSSNEAFSSILQVTINHLGYLRDDDQDQAYLNATPEAQDALNR